MKLLRTRVGVLVGAGCLAAGIAPAGHAFDAPPDRPATRLLQLSADASDAGVRIRVHTDGRPKGVAIFELEDPRRLVIDLLDLRDAETPASIQSGIPEISQLRVGRHPGRIRIVADAAAALPSFGPVATRTLRDGLEVEIAVSRGEAALDRLLEVPTAVPSRAAGGAATELAPPASQPLDRPSDDVRVELEKARSRVGGSIPRGMSGRLDQDRIRLGLFDDRIRVTTRYARSGFFAASPGPSEALDSLHGSDLDRWIAPAGRAGEAFSGRLDGALWSFGPARVDGFASFQRVDPLFEWGERGEENPFGNGDGRRLEAGGVISASLDALRRLDAGAGEHVLWSLVPDSLWGSLSQGRAEADGARPEGAATRTLSAGLSWSGASSSATLGLWKSSYASGGGAADWSGSGADLAGGLYGERWSLDAGLGAERSSTDQPGYHSFESSVSGFVSLSARPERFLPLSATLTLDRYRADYGASATPLRMEIFGLQTGVDLAELLLPIRWGIRPSLRASYGAVWSLTRSQGADPELVLEHGPMLTFGIDF